MSPNKVRAGPIKPARVAPPHRATPIISRLRPLKFGIAPTDPPCEYDKGLRPPALTLDRNVSPIPSAVLAVAAAYDLVLTLPFVAGKQVLAFDALIIPLKKVAGPVSLPCSQRVAGLVASCRVGPSHPPRGASISSVTRRQRGRSKSKHLDSKP